MNIQNHLLCVTGLTPQVVTETLFAIHHAGESIPEYIHILTTTEGAERARLTLIKDQWLTKFYMDYGLKPKTAEFINIYELSDANGQPLKDIRSQADNQAIADGITEKIRQLTAENNTALHVSIAGGRKTMGFYAGYALSLYGRRQDRLSHVLVSADYESHPQFYYPTPYSQVIYANDPTRKPLDTQDAEVVLADIAFVRLRHGLDNALLQGQSSFSESVQRAQQSFAAPRLVINLANRRLYANQQMITLKPADMAFYYWLIQRQFSIKGALSCPADGVPDPDYSAEYLHYFKVIAGELGIAARTLNTLANGMEKSFFEQHKSSINKAIKQILGIHAQHYLIHPQGKRPYTKYALKLEQHQIEYQEEQ